MIEFDQEVGRGGRGGEIVRSVMMISESNFRKQLMTEAGRMSANQWGLREFIVELKCRRIAISGFMNDSDWVDDCLKISGEVCDRCGGVMSSVEKRMRGIWNWEEVNLLFIVAY